MDKDQLNEAKELLKVLKDDHQWYEDDYTDRALDIICEWDETGEYIRDEETLDELVRHEAEDGFSRVKFFIAHAELNPPMGWRFNGYGNIETTTRDDLICSLEDIINNNEEK